MSHWRHTAGHTRILNRLAVVVGTLCLIFGALFVYLNVINARPQKLLSDATADLTEFLFGTTPHSITGSASIVQSDGEKVTLTSIFEASFDKGLLDEQSTRFMKVDTQLQQGAHTTAVQAEVMTVPSHGSYIKIANLKAIIHARVQAALLSYVGDGATRLETIANSYENKWIAIPTEDLKELGLIQPANTDQCLNQLSAADRQQRLRTAYQKHHFIDIEKFEKKKEFYFQLAVNEPVFDQFIKELGGDLSGCQWVNYVKDITHIELWLSKVSHRPIKSTIHVQEDQVKTDVTITFLQSAQPLPAKPSESLSIKQLKQELEQVIGSPVSFVPQVTGAQ